MRLLVDNCCSWTKFVDILLLSLSLLVGCANPGPPRPPSLHLPKVVSDLSAERVGPAVRLRWTTPDITTDGISVTGSMIAEICRASSGIGTASKCSFTLQVPVKPGPSEAIDVLPATRWANPPTLLTYQVSILNSQGRSAGPSSPSFAASGSAPPAITDFRGEATERGAMLQWEPTDNADVIELGRVHKIAVATKPRRSGGFQPSSQEPNEMHFRAAGLTATSSSFGIDAGGSIDPTARRGETYTYTAQRVRNTMLNGHALEIRSTLSPAVTIVMHDSFPPKAPTGLEVILAGQKGGSPALDLSWRPNTEPDLVGYFVYRQELGADGTTMGMPHKLTTSPILEPGFRDITLVTGHTYDYFVTAIDGSGNESVKGTPARQAVP